MPNTHKFPADIWGGIVRTVGIAWKSDLQTGEIGLD
jgi:hypothetical protein